MPDRFETDQQLPDPELYANQPTLASIGRISEGDLVKLTPLDADIQDNGRIGFSVASLKKLIEGFDPDKTVLWMPGNEEDQNSKNKISFIGGRLIHDLYTKEFIADGEPLLLDGRKYELLSLLASSLGQVFSYHDISESIWGDAFTTRRTIRAHVCHLRRKLGPFSWAVRTRRNYGYFFDDSEIGDPTKVEE